MTTTRLLLSMTIFTMWLAFVGCASRKADVAASASMEVQAPVEAHLTECQLLWSDEEAMAQGVSRQRNMYGASGRRLSEKAAYEGFNAPTREEGMREFNRAWRFNPANAMAYWGAGIVRGCEALKYEADRAVAKRCWNDSLRLFEMGSRFLITSSKETICEFKMDWAASCRLYAAFIEEASKEEAAAFLRRAEELLMPYRDCTLFHPEGNRRVSARVAHELWKVYTALGQDDEAAKCKQERDRLNAVDPIPELDMGDATGRWME